MKGDEIGKYKVPLNENNGIIWENVPSGWEPQKRSDATWVWRQRWPFEDQENWYYDPEITILSSSGIMHINNKEIIPSLPVNDHYPNDIMIYNQIFQLLKKKKYEREKAERSEKYGSSRKGARSTILGHPGSVLGLQLGPPLIATKQEPQTPRSPRHIQFSPRNIVVGTPTRAGAFIQPMTPASPIRREETPYSPRYVGSTGTPDEIWESSENIKKKLPGQREGLPYVFKVSKPIEKQIALEGEQKFDLRVQDAKKHTDKEYRKEIPTSPSNFSEIAKEVLKPEFEELDRITKGITVGKEKWRRPNPENLIRMIARIESDMKAHIPFPTWKKFSEKRIIMTAPEPKEYDHILFQQTIFLIRLLAERILKELWSCLVIWKSAFPRDRRNPLVKYEEDKKELDEEEKEIWVQEKEITKEIGFPDLGKEFKFRSLELIINQDPELAEKRRRDARKLIESQGYTTQEFEFKKWSERSMEVLEEFFEEMERVLTGRIISTFPMKFEYRGSDKLEDRFTELRAQMTGIISEDLWNNLNATNWRMLKPPRQDSYTTKEFQAYGFYYRQQIENSIAKLWEAMKDWKKKDPYNGGNPLVIASDPFIISPTYGRQQATSTQPITKFEEMLKRRGTTPRIHTRQHTMAPPPINTPPKKPVSPVSSVGDARKKREGSPVRVPDYLNWRGMQRPGYRNQEGMAVPNRPPHDRTPHQPLPGNQGGGGAPPSPSSPSTPGGPTPVVPGQGPRGPRGHRGHHGPPGPPGPIGPQGQGGGLNNRDPTEPIFEVKIKRQDLPEWNGDKNQIIEWIAKVEDLARMSNSINQQMGRWLPTRFTDEAETWWISLENITKEATRTWRDLYNLFTRDWMTVEWFNDQQARGLRMGFRDRDHPDETPRNYVTRKTQILLFTMGQNVNEGTIINEILNKAPKDWMTILNSGEITTLEELKIRVNREEGRLLRGLTSRSELDRIKADLAELKKNMNGNRYKTTAHIAEAEESHEVETLIAERPQEPKKYAFPPMNWKKSTDKSPKSEGKRGCRHCSSLEHWDNDCPKAEQGKELEKKKRLERLNNYKAKVHMLEAEEEIDNSIETEAKNSLSSDEESQ
jgi:hypothetical protein